MSKRVALIYTFSTVTADGKDYKIAGTVTDAIRSVDNTEISDERVVEQLEEIVRTTGGDDVHVKLFPSEEAFMEYARTDFIQTSPDHYMIKEFSDQEFVKNLMAEIQSLNQ